MKIEVGDAVTLISGGEVMTVNTITDDDIIECIWNKSGHAKSFSYNRHALKKYLDVSQYDFKKLTEIELAAFGNLLDKMKN